MTLPVAIAGLGAYLPSARVTNDDLARVLDTSDEWIRSRTGIVVRHRAAPEEATSDLAVAATRAALDDAGVVASDLVALIVATTTPDHPIPATAPLVAAALGIGVPAFDVNAACSGFVFGLHVAATTALALDGPVALVGAETLSRAVDPEDRSVAVLFGDGAGAVVLRPDPAAKLGPFALGVDGTDPSMLWTRAGGSRLPVDEDVLASGADHLTMRGGDVYRHAVARMSEASSQVLERSGLAVGDVDLLVAHQANRRILDAVAQRLGVAPERCHVTVEDHGNTSAASIPLALVDARDRGRLLGGERVLLTAFGAGLTWGACLVRWSTPSRPAAELTA